MNYTKDIITLSALFGGAPRSNKSIEFSLSPAEVQWWRRVLPA